MVSRSSIPFLTPVRVKPVALWQQPFVSPDRRRLAGKVVRVIGEPRGPLSKFEVAVTQGTSLLAVADRGKLYGTEFEV